MWDQTYTPHFGRQSLNHWTTREVPLTLYLEITNIYYLIVSEGQGFRSGFAGDSGAGFLRRPLSSFGQGLPPSES